MEEHGRQNRRLEQVVEVHGPFRPPELLQLPHDKKKT